MMEYRRVRNVSGEEMWALIEASKQQKLQEGKPFIEKVSQSVSDVLAKVYRAVLLDMRDTMHTCQSSPRLRLLSEVYLRKLLD